MDTAEVTPTVKFGKSIVIHGDDWQARVFSSASQPKRPERSFFVLYEDAYGEQSLDQVTEAELDERLARGRFGPHSVEEMLRMANLDRSMNEYSFPAPAPIGIKDI